MRKQIIEILKKDSRATVKDMANMLGTDEHKVIEIIKALENEGVILQYTIAVNDEILDRDDTVTSFIEVKVTPERDKGFDSIAKRLQKFDEVQSVYLMSGSYDLLVVVKGKSLKEIATFVSGKLSPLGSVLSTSTHFLLKKYKENGIVMGNEAGELTRLNFSF